MFSNKYLPEKRKLEDKYARFKNIKFPRGNYQTNSSETFQNQIELFSTF